MRVVLEWLAAPLVTVFCFAGLLVASLLRAVRTENRTRHTTHGVIAVVSIGWLILAALGAWDADLARWSPIAFLFLVLLYDDQPDPPAEADAPRELTAQDEDRPSEAI